jgi:anti-sigma factor RsiW
MKVKISPRDIEMLSAYLDRQLEAKKNLQLEERLKKEPELRSAYDDLRGTRAVMRSLPRLKAPRNFTLTPEMVGRSKAKDSPSRQFFPVFQFVSAMASLLLVVVLVGDLLGLGLASAEPVAMQEAQGIFETQETGLAEAPLSGERSLAAETLAEDQARDEIEAQPALANDQLELQAGSTPGITDTITATAILSETLATDPLLAAPPSLVTEPGQNPSASQAGNGQPDRSLWRVAEIVLALIALVCGLAAILLRRLHATG